MRADSGPPLSEVQCGGAARFDGTTWLGPILPGMCVESIDLAADGSVWLLAHDAESDDGLVDLFVVTSDAADAAYPLLANGQYSTRPSKMRRNGTSPGAASG